MGRVIVGRVIVGRVIVGRVIEGRVIVGRVNGNQTFCLCSSELNTLLLIPNNYKAIIDLRINELFFL